MKYTQLLYASQAGRPMEEAEQQELLAKARLFNASQQITGLLSVCDGYFVQCLEGERARVNQLYNHIIKDSRHHSVELLLYHSVDRRLFPNWSMGLLPKEQLKLHILGADYESLQFSPMELKDKYCVSLLYALAEYHDLESFTPL